MLLTAASNQAAPVQAEEMSIAFPASADPEIRQAQQTMVESWAYVQVGAQLLGCCLSAVLWYNHELQ